MEYKNLLLTVANHIATIKINNPQTLNALNTQVLKDIEQVFVDLEKRKDVKAVILTGEGRAFVAGADIKEMSELNPDAAKAFGAFGSGVFRKIEQFLKPVIAAINGFALGGGCELAMACDIRLASEKAKFGQPEVGLGIIPGFTGTQRLPRLVGMGIAKELIYTGKIIDANEAYRIGLVNLVTPHDDLMDEAMKLALNIVEKAPLAIEYAKEAMDKGISLNMDDAISLENNYFSKCFNTLDQKKGMKAFMNKEKVDFQGK